MAKYDVVVIGAGAAGLTAASLLAVEGKQRRVLSTARRTWVGGRMAVPDEGFTVNARRPPHRGPGLRADEGLRARRQDAGARRGLRRHARLGPREQPLGARSGTATPAARRAEEGHQGAARDTEWDERLDRLGRPPAAPVAAPAHRRPGRRRPLRVHHRPRVHDRQLVGPLRQRQPLRPQDALRRAGHRRLLVLARPGLGRHVAPTSPTPSRPPAATCACTPSSASSIEDRQVKGVAIARRAAGAAQRVLRGGDPRGRPT